MLATPEMQTKNCSLCECETSVGDLYEWVDERKEAIVGLKSLCFNCIRILFYYAKNTGNFATANCAKDVDFDFDKCAILTTPETPTKNCSLCEHEAFVDDLHEWFDERKEAKVGIKSLCFNCIRSLFYYTINIRTPLLLTTLAKENELPLESHTRTHTQKTKVQVDGLM